MSTTIKRTKGGEHAADVAALLRARNPLIWIVSREEARVEGYLFEAAASLDPGYIARTWDVAQGVADMSGAVTTLGSQDPGDTLKAISTAADAGRERGMWIMRDLPPWLVGPGGISTVRQLRNLARKLPKIGGDGAQVIVVLSPSGDVPPELSNHATVIEWALPDREEIAAVLDAMITALPERVRAAATPSNGLRDAAIDAAVGLTSEEAQACYARSIVSVKRIDPATVAKEKKRVIARERVLEWFDPLPGGLDAVGGLDVLKTWLVSRRQAYSAKAREYGLPAPRGALLVGVPGCGKSLIAKAIATAWGVPLLRLDLNGLKSKFVGESEGNLRRMFKVVEAIGRAVLWVDEIEKALGGATGGGADGGVSMDALGAVLSWMQERQGEAFVIATANDVSSLPPELMRKGRFDELWFIDLPNGIERADILRAALRANGRAESLVEAEAVAAKCNGFTGAEIAALVPDAMYAAFDDNARDITTDDLLAAAANVVPLSKTAADKITALRAWAEGRARRATTPETIAAYAPGARALDL